MSEEDSSRPSPGSVRITASRAHPEIELYASEALARFGAPGTLRVEGKYLVLYAPQGLLRVELEGLDDQWAGLSDESRRRRASALVRRLMARRSLSPTPPPRRGASVWAWPLVLMAAAAALWAAFAARPQTSDEVVRRASSASSLRASADATEDRRQRAVRVCENARARVLRGATIGPTETEGWVVDVLVVRWPAKDALDARHAVLDTFLAPGAPGELRRFVWSEQPELVALEGSATGVRVTSDVVEGPSGRATQLRLTFGGALVDRYFRPEERVRYFHVASALSDALQATYAGVFARCEGGNTHHVGSWFRGASPAEAAVALVYLVGLYAEPPHLAEPFLRPDGTEGLDRAYALASLREAANGIDQRTLVGLLGSSGGMVLGTPNGASVISFPFTDANRASRASRDIARALRLAPPP